MTPLRAAASKTPRQPSTRLPPVIIRLLGILALLNPLSPTALPARAQGVVKSKFGDWEIRCDTPAGAGTEQCALIQSVTAEDKANVNLVVIVLKTSDGKSRLLRVIAPLGVLLPEWIGTSYRPDQYRQRRFCQMLANRLYRRGRHGR